MNNAPDSVAGDGVGGEVDETPLPCPFCGDSVVPNATPWGHVEHQDHPWCPLAHGLTVLEQWNRRAFNSDGVIPSAIPAIRAMLHEAYPNCTDEQIGEDEWWWPAMLKLAKLEGRAG
jgi:hypothetical protein